MKSCLMQVVALLALAALLPGSVHAGFVADLLTISQDGAGTMVLSSDMLGCTDTSDSTMTCQSAPGQTLVPGNEAFTWVLEDWNFSADFDPMLNVGFGFKNTGATATFTITSSLPVLPTGPSTVMGGSTGGSVTDDGDGVGGLGTAAPDPFFVGLIDGVPQVATSLHLDPSNFPGAGFPGAFAFGGQTVNIPAVFSGLPGPTIPGPAATVSIGIRHRFQLASQDSMGASSFFQVEAAPEPSTGALLGIGLVGVALAARRRS